MKKRNGTSALWRALAGALLLGLAVAPQPAQAASTPCGKTPGLVCSEVDVPLDRSGVVPGTIPLHVEVLPADGTTRRGVVFLIAGGPGQGSAHSFDLGTPDNADFYRFMFPGYTLVTYDDRGTGASGLLDCPALQADAPADQATQLAADCAALIGPQRTFYSTVDHAEDLEAVRQALGFDKIAIWGVSYGTKLAQAYALAHPEHVERLVLDSVVPYDRADPFGTAVLQAMPATLAQYCPGTACRAATPDFGGDVVAVANALAAKPLQGAVLLANGKTKTERVRASDFLGLLLDADLNPGLAAELPAAVHAARNGHMQALLRLYALDGILSIEPSVDLSYALYLATVCHDGPFPWSPDTPIADRPALVQAAVAALPAGAFGPFGTWAQGFGTVDICLDWPSPTGGAPLAAGPLPNVPVLAVSGGLDLRTPTTGAASVVAQFPQGHLLVVPGVGHSVLSADPSGCSQQAVRNWILGGNPPATCARPPAFVTPTDAFPAVGAHRLTPGQTLAVVAKTVREAEAMWLMTMVASQHPLPVGGLDAGKLVPAERAFALDHYSIATGVTLSGRISVVDIGPPTAFKGTVTVGGKAAAAGRLMLARGSLRGKLGGRAVG